ncbi:amino acid adenylation domain-containing protein [Pendulispora brunnea]|uniref:Amino acid adenylation domain-containing protein n=1 Tax=Pendulispora brunnea TaxID=2905690 RepID=A0ABZ2KGU0_9BACT
MTEEEKLRAYLEKATSALRQTRERLRDIEEKAHEPIAIVSMSCRFPGGVRSPEDLWRLLQDGVDAVSAFPGERGWEDLYDPDPEAKGKSYVREGGFLYDAHHFDPSFFGISHRDALTIDPQQRMLLEASWEAFERAGIDPASSHGRDANAIGVFVGIMYNDYGARLLHAPEAFEGNVAIGSGASIASGRIAYTFGLDGPAVTVDTACSSSLVAIHLACQSLRKNECSLVLAGGATVMATPTAFIEFSRQRGLSPDGRCKAFSDSADGVGWGEGVGLLLLERLSDARRHGHPVLAVIRGSAVNQDGRSQGLTAPNGPAQQRVIRQALAHAQLTPADVDAVEAHGTGTTLGDPIEAQALLATYGKGRAQEQPLWLGTIKSNLGHTQAAAGVAGIIKMVLAMHHGVLPKTLHAEVPSRRVDWTAGTIRLLTEPTPWNERGRPRRAAVSSFGISGTNAHVVLEEAPRRAEVARAELTARAWPILLSAKSESALRAQAARLREHLAPQPEWALGDVAFSLATTRTHFEERAAVTARERTELLEALGAWAEGRSTAVVGHAKSRGKLALLFTGQGSQRAGMGRELYATYPVFREALDAVCAGFDPHLDRPLRTVLFAPEDSDDAARLDETYFTQPALFALEVALFRLVVSWGLEPDFLMGHSIGELVCAHVADVLSLEDACTLVAARARLMQELPPGGTMMAIRASEDEVLPLLDAHGKRASIAAINGPEAIVVSGDEDAVAAIAAHFEARGRKTTRLSVHHAFHSHRMDAMLEAFATVARNLSYGPPRIPIVSNVTGVIASAQELGSPEYWVRHVRQAVRFSDGVRTLESEGVDAYLELGPHGVLCALAEQALSKATSAVFAPAMRKDRSEAEAIAAAASALHVCGHALDWKGFFAPFDVRSVPLPTYAFQRESFWLEAPSVVRGVPSSDAERWCYRTVWKPLAPPPSTTLSGTWWLVAPPGDATADALEGALTAHGAGVVRIAWIDGPELVVRLREASAEAPSGIASLLGDAASLALVQALGEAQVERPLWLLTRGAVCVGPTDAMEHPEQALAWGLGRSVALEHPERWGGLIDLPPALDARTMDWLVAALAGLGRETREDQLAVRPSGLFACRFVRAPLGKPARAWKPRGTALVTGGTGALGAHVARWLVNEGAEHIVLTSRRGLLAPGASELERELHATGARITIAACDASDRRALAALLASLEAQGDAPSIVVHAAGVTQQTKLEAMSPAEFAEVTAAKVQGARNLDELLGNRALDAFVLFASLSGVLGGMHQAAYAAANAYLDALAAQRRARGHRATSIAWGAWGGGGMADGNLEPVLRRRGLLPMDPEAAIAVLHQTIARDETALTVADVDWDRLAPLYASPRARAILSDLPEARRAVVARPPARAEGPLPDPSQLLDLVLAETAAVLHHPDPSQLRPDTGFLDLGLDSLTAVELRKRLAHLTGVNLPATLAFDHPTPRRVAIFLREALAPTAAPPLEAPMRRAGDDVEPIAIVGMGLRLPGGVVDLGGLWSLLEQGTDAVVPMPEDRFRPHEFYDPDPDAKGKSYVRDGAFLDGVDGFDAAFFSISPREATYMDPQHRLLLETAWQSLEDAGIVPASLRDSTTGVFVGIGPSDYELLQSAAHEDAAYAVLGTHTSFAAGRLAFTLGLQGPALSLDTACSSSLVALHLACRALQRGECDLALAAGVQIMSAPEGFVLLSRIRALAPDGRSKTFSAKADGYGRGEGVVVVTLERLRDAHAHGRNVLAVVRGSAVNHDGESSSITAPNGTAQQKVLRAALGDARLDPADVDFVECHGTGTELGDPIEVQALAAVYGQARDGERPLWLGAIKSNIGHLESAAGLAGVAKVVAALQHQALPASLHAGERNPHIDWDALPVRVTDALRPWERRQEGALRRAGVSSFGISGTNAHVLIEEAPATAPHSGPSQEGNLAFVVSGRTDAALRAQLERLRAYIASSPDLRLADVAFSLATARTHFERRAVVVASERAALMDGLGALAEGRSSSRAVLASVDTVRGKVAFVFPGQGSQWIGMALPLWETSPVFRDQLEACERAFAPYVDWSLRAVLRGEGGDASLDRVDVVQPVLFAVMVSLAAVWRSMGIEPDAVIGHSQGEIAAAYVAGALSLEDAAKVVTLRSRALIQLAGQGAMAAVDLGADALGPHLARFGERLSIAAINSPHTAVVSGEPEAVDALLAELEAAGTFARKVRVDYASHSAQIAPLEGALLQALSGLAPRTPSLPLYSTVTGKRLDEGELDAAYWVRNLRRTVRFGDATASLLGDGYRLFVEVSPHPVLTPALQDAFESANVSAAAVGTLRRDDGDLGRILASLGELHVLGHPVDWSAVFAPDSAQRVALPTYAFQRERYWIDVPRALAPSQDPLLRVDWTELPSTDLPLAAAFQAPALRIEHHDDLSALLANLDQGAPVPELALLHCPATGATVEAADLISAAHRATQGALSLLQRWLADERLASCTLVVLTQRAIATRVEEDVTDLAHAPLWGLVRSAQLEHPDRTLRIIDLDDTEASQRALPRALASAESQLALRDGRIRAPKLAYVASPAQLPPLALRPEGTVLITGGTGMLGALVARHLVQKHGVRHLLLSSRQGAAAPAAEALKQELEASGARVTLAACDAADRNAVEALLASVAPEHPLTAVLHAAGTLDDGLLGSLTPARLQAVLRTKVDAAVHLHELSQNLDLSAFVLFSSLTGVLGSPGQANYAAANAFLDAIAHHRRSRGLSALALDWGYWAEKSSMTAHLTAADLRRMARGGVRPLSNEEGLALFDAALQRNDTLVAAGFDAAALQAQAETIPPLLQGLVRAQAPRALASNAQSGASLEQRLLLLPPEDRERTLLDLVRTEVAAVLGLSSDVLEPHRPLRELGLDSLMAVELRTRLGKLTGTRIPVGTFFAQTSVRALAELLGESVPGDHGEATQLPTLVLEPGARHEPFALTPIQRAYWLGRGSLFALGGVATHFYIELDFTGLDLGRLESAMDRLIARHDMLRAIVHRDGLQQVLTDVPPMAIEVLDVRELAPAEAEARAIEVRAAMSHRVLPTDTWPLFEVQATRLPEGVVRLHVGVDLLIADVKSFMIIVRELARYYADLDTQLPALELRFRDYARWQESLAGTPALERDLAYWRTRAEKLPPGPELPLAVTPESIGVPRFQHYAAELDDGTWGALKARAQARGLTPSGVLMAAFAEVLGTWSRRPHFTLNLTLFNRLPVHPDVDRLVGDFTSVILVEIDPADAPSFEARAQRYQRQLGEDLDHHLVGGLDVTREIARARGGFASFPVVFTSSIGVGDLTADIPPGGARLLGTPYGISQTPQVWLDHQVVEIAGRLAYSWDVVEGLFPAGMIEAMFEAYARLLVRLAASDEEWAKPDAILTPPEHLARRAAVNATAGPLPTQLLHERVELQASRTPDAIAVVDARRRLRYGELVREARRIARRLRADGIAPGELVAVSMPKGWPQIVGVLAVLMAGGAYVPIDPELPEMRRQALLAHCHVQHVLTEADVLGASLEEGDEGPLEPVQALTDLAYVIFTSGSTGQPKGVAIEHGAAVNTLLDLEERFAIGPDDRVLGISSLSFDLSVWDVFGVLGAGGTLVLPEPGAVRNPARVAEWLRNEGITIWNSVPALLQMLVDYAGGRPDVLPSSLRLALLSGDWIPVTLPDRARALVPAWRIVSLGGATEASIWSILHPIDQVDPRWTSIPYGRPMRNQSFHVLDTRLRPCPDGVAGELYIGGIGLAREYFGDAERTRERFIVHPHSGERLYRTGDLGRFQSNGDIEFLGREDHQVKVGGHRIELGEIEWHLEQHPLVGRAVVSTVGQARGPKQLAAYLVPATAVPDRKEDARAHRAALKLGPGWRPSGAVSIDLAARGDRPSAWLRKSYRVFDGQGLTAAALARVVATPPRAVASPGRTPSAGILGAWLEVLRPVPAPRQPLPKYRYASAGSLYAVHVLVDVPEGIADLHPGRYGYDREAHRLVRLGDAPVTALGLHLVADVARVQPIYGDLAEPLCHLDAGYLAELLIDRAAELGLAFEATRSNAAESVAREVGHDAFWALSLHASPAAEEISLEPWLVVRHALADLSPGVYRHTETGWTPISDGGIADGQFPSNEVVAAGAPAALLLVGKRNSAEMHRAGRLGHRWMEAATAHGVGLCPIGWIAPDALAAERADCAIVHAFLAGAVAEAQLRDDVGSELRLTAGDLRRWLGARLPTYMVPTHVTVLGALPITSNGKVDRSALPDPTRAAEHDLAPQAPAASQGSIEDRIAAVVEKRLGRERIDRQRPFFELGADSLALVQIHALLVAELGLTLDVVDLFYHPSVAELSRRVRETAPETIAQREAPRAPIANEPMAIVGVGCRFPGGVRDPEALWQLLATGTDATREVPLDRWDADALYDADPDAAGKMVARRGGFLDDVGHFDAEFFGISPREAEAMDPRHRLLLETAWEALERAGIVPEQLRGTQTGVFVGLMSSHDYLPAQMGLEELDGYIGTGNTGSVASGRLSYVLGTHGPSMTIDTACSSSLVALHVACQSLRSGECDMALVGGVTLVLTPGVYVEFSRLRGLAPDGRCKSFSAAGDGVGWSEGAGVLVVKRLSDAMDAGDAIVAVVRGSAVNQDGRSAGLTAPNGRAQEAVLRRALDMAGVEPHDVGYVEAHGTGTRLGDPIEARALGAVYGQGRAAPLAIGSVKSNLGHTQAAAGIAAVLKAALALGHRAIPKSLHAAELHPDIAWDALSLELARTHRPWPEARFAGVSAFGASGTNAHVILERPPVREYAASADGSWLPFVLAGRTERALAARAGQLRAHLEAHPELALADVAYSLATTRTHFAKRGAVVARDRAGLFRALEALERGDASSVDSVSGAADVGGKLVFVFPGQGSQWAQMGRALLEESDVFRAHIDACERALSPHVDWSLRALLENGYDEDRTSVIQPVLFAVMVSLAAVWRAMGITPDAVVGHSQGEIAAAYVAGALSLEDAAKVVALRSRALARLEGKGAMAAVELPASDLEARLARWGNALSIAAVNGPRSAVVSGDPVAIDELLRELESARIFARKVRVDYASHGAHVEALREEILSSLAGIQARSADIPFFSTVRVAKLEGAELDAAYWYENLRQAVRFGDAVGQLAVEHRFFVEVSPHPVLAMALRETLESRSIHGAVVGSLRRDEGDLRRLSLSVAELYTQGFGLDWTKVLPQARRVELPVYPFQGEHYWLGSSPKDHPLLGQPRVSADTGSWIFETSISQHSPAWVGDHAVRGSTLVPGVAFFEWARAAAAAIGRVDTFVLTDASVHTPLLVPEHGDVRLQVIVAPSEAGDPAEVRIYSAPPASDAEAPTWTLHAEAHLKRADGEHETPSAVPSLPPQSSDREDIEGCYDALKAHGVDYGPRFRTLRESWRESSPSSRVRWVRAALDEASREEAVAYGIHPALLDGVLHAAALWQDDARGIFLPFSLTELRLWQKGAQSVWARVEHTHDGDTLRRLDAMLYDEQGRPVGEVRGLHLKRAPDSAWQPRADRDRYHIVWQESPARSRSRLSGRWALVGDGGPRDEALARALEAAGLRIQRMPHASPADVDGYLCLPPDATEPGESLVDRTFAEAARALAALQTLLSNAERAPRLVWITRGAVATMPDEAVPALEQAPLWGLLRSARHEYPDVDLRLVDVGPDDLTAEALIRALSLEEEPEVAVRGPHLRVPRLLRAKAASPSPESPLRFEGTFLVTGGLGVLGRHTARWLVERGASHLVLTSRRGRDTEGAGAFEAELTALGAQVTIVACDVSNADAVHALVRTATSQAPLRGVVHCAGALDDGVLLNQSPERFVAVMAPKVAGAWNLHRATEGLQLDAFVLFSSLVGVLGGSGQATYGAANTFLDALAQHRRALGLPATSLAWGYWGERSNLTAGLGDAELARMARAGLGALSAPAGMQLLESALHAGDTVAVTAALEFGPMRAAFERSHGGIPPLLARLLRPSSPTRAPSVQPDARARLNLLSETERRAAVLDLVREEAAKGLGLRSGADIAPHRPLLELGLNSVMALEIRRQLGARLGLSLPATLLFECPTPEQIADRAIREMNFDIPTPKQQVAQATNNEDALVPNVERLGAIGEFDLAFELVGVSSRIRRVRERKSQQPASRTQAVKLAAGQSGPSVMCFPTTTPPTGSIQYARFANAFAGQRDVWALPNPGFARGEHLPEDRASIVRMHAENVVQCANGAPFLLVGCSSGGWIAHATAEHLERIGILPAAVFLLDTYRMRDITEGIGAAFRRAWLSELPGIPRTEHEFTAMPWYTSLFQDWEPARLACPTLFLRVTEPVPGMEGEIVPGSGCWQPHWAGANSVVDLPGTHFTILTEQADTAARLVEEWLANPERAITPA